MYSLNNYHISTLMALIDNLGNVTSLQESEIPVNLTLRVGMCTLHGLYSKATVHVW